MDWFRLALQLRGSVVPTIFPRVLFCSGFGIFISLLYHFKVPVSWDILGSVITNVAYNLVLGLLLVFRTNTAYERFWEGRKAWGTLVVNVRNLARHIQVAIAAPEVIDQENKATTLRLLVAFGVATKLFLRHEPVDSQLEALVSSTQVLQLKSAKNPPLKITFWIGEYLQQQYDRHCLSMDQLIAMNHLIDSLVEGLTGSERIAKTPIPIAYAIYLKRLLLIYCISLPFEIVKNLGWWTGITVAIISFVLFGIEEIGNEIENPFGHDPNDLPLDDICQTMLDNVQDFINIRNLDSPEVSLDAQSLESEFTPGSLTPSS